jgi:glycogen debranching enzyme|tara:strand:+ start:227 stop:745 length:519 start_codon:yes stop_codon:yes gene_type:complete
LKRINKWLLRWLRACINALEKSVRVDTQSKIKTPIVDKGVNLLILRDTFTDESTIGELFINGERFCDTLELPYRDNQRSISCIPTGSYKVRLRYPRESATREYLHLLVQEVKDRSFILFHRGNSAKDTRGCILVGQGSQHNIVHNSTLAMDLLIKEIINLGGTNINLIIKNK